jgi:carboxyl-terminal processing protease
MLRVLSSLVLTGALLCPLTAAAQGPAPPSNCSAVSSQNLWVRTQMTTYYYWYQQLPDVNPAGYNSPEAYLEAVRYRPIDNHYSFITSAASNDSYYNDSQTIAFGFVNQQTSTEVIPLQVYPGSPASEAGLERGDRITQINGKSVAALAAAGGVNAAFGAAEVGVAADIVFIKPNGESRQARMVKRLITVPSVSLTRAFDVDGRRVGYLNFKAFVRPSEAALNEAFAALKAAGVNELVLDLRYNGGGLVSVAAQLASLIGGARTTGQVMFTQVHNNKLAPTWNETTRFTATQNALNLDRLVVITTRGSASASELVINALRPYIPVAVIGDTTYGKPVGQYGLTFCEKVLYPVAFTIRNANNEGDYFDGIAPTCAAADDPTHQLGDAEEASFAEALTFIRTGACSASTASAARALRVKPDARLTGWAAIVNIW